MSTLTLYTSQTDDSTFQLQNSTTQNLGGLSGVVSVAYLNGDTPPASYGGCRFENVTIAGTATVSAATLGVWGSNSKQDTMRATVYGVKPDQGLFTSTASFVQGLTTSYPTTATVSWSATLSQSAYNTVSVLSIVSELIAQGGWTSGTAISFVLVGTTTSDTGSYYGYGHGSDYEQLVITYTAGAPSYVPPPFHPSFVPQIRASSWHHKPWRRPGEVSLG